MRNQFDINVCGRQGLIPCTYKTVVLKPNVIDGKNMLTQGMMDKPNTKYVIKHDFVISDAVVTKSARVLSTNVSQCGNAAYAVALANYNAAHEAWIEADNAYTNNPNDTTLAAKNAAYAALQDAQATLTGTPQYYYFAGTAINLTKGQHVSVPDGCVLLNGTLNGLADFELAPSNTTVYVGSAVTGTYEYTVLDGIEIPANCLIEFDGGSISDGVLVGDETILIYDQEVDIVLKNVTLLGTFEQKEGSVNVNKKDNTDGMAIITLKHSKGFAEQLTQENTIYRILYNFDLNGEEVEVPADCILHFEGGCLSNGTLVGQSTIVNTEGDYIFDESIVLSGTFTGRAYPDWVRTATDDASIQINKLNSVLPDIFFKGKDYHLRTEARQRGNWIGDSYKSKIIVHVPVNTEFKNWYLEFSKLHIVGVDNNVHFLRFSNNININDCLIEDFDYLFDIDHYVGRISINNTRFERIKSGIDRGNAAVNQVQFNNCFIDFCTGWFRPSTIYTSVAFNNCNIQQTNLIEISDNKALMIFPSVSFNNCYFEADTINFAEHNSYGSLCFNSCHFYFGGSVIETGVNPTQYASGANLIISFDSCDFYIKNDESNMPLFNINNYILIKLTGSLNLIGKLSGGIAQGVASAEMLINNPDRLWYDVTRASAGVWEFSSAKGRYNDNRTLKTKVIYVYDKGYQTQERLDEIFSLPNVTYCIRSEIALQNNQEITMPENCAIVFEGGAIKSGTTGVCKLRGNNTSLVLNGRLASEVLNNVDLPGTFTHRGNSLQSILQAKDWGYSFFNNDSSYMKPLWWDGTAWRDATGTLITIKRRGTWAEKPDIASVPIGFRYYCTDKKAPEASAGVNTGVAIYTSAAGYWVDSLGRIVNDSYPEFYKGAFADKPSLAAYQAGQQYFDTTNNRIIIWNGTRWVDTLGNPVDTVYPKVIGTPTAGNLAKFDASKNIEDAGVAPQV